MPIDVFEADMEAVADQNYTAVEVPLVDANAAGKNLSPTRAGSPSVQTSNHGRVVKAARARSVVHRFVAKQKNN